MGHTCNSCRCRTHSLSFASAFALACPLIYSIQNSYFDDGSRPTVRINDIQRHAVLSGQRHPVRNTHSILDLSSLTRLVHNA